MNQQHWSFISTKPKFIKLRCTSNCILAQFSIVLFSIQFDYENAVLSFCIVCIISLCTYRFFFLFLEYKDSNYTLFIQFSYTTSLTFHVRFFFIFSTKIPNEKHKIQFFFSNRNFFEWSDRNENFKETNQSNQNKQ